MDPDNPPSSKSDKTNLKIFFLLLVISEFIFSLFIGYKLEDFALCSISPFILVFGFSVAFNEHVYNAIAFIFINSTLVIITICNYFITDDDIEKVNKEIKIKEYKDYCVKLLIGSGILEFIFIILLILMWKKG